MVGKLNDRPLHNVTIRQLNAVAAVGQERTITSAASVLGVTPPAVTLQIKALERLLGLSLFERSRTGLRPTDAGRYLISVHARLTSLIEEANEAVIEMRGAGRGHLRIGAVSAAQYFLPRIAAAFRKHHPKIEIELFIANRARTVEELGEFKLDMAVMGRPHDTVAYDHQMIGDHPHVVVAATGHRLRSKRRIELKALAEETFLTREAGSGTRLLMERTFMMARFTPRASMEFNSTETIKQGVIAGLGVAFVSAHTVAREVRAGELVVLRIQGFPVMRHWYAVRPRERQLSAAGQAAWRFLLSDGASFLPER